MSNTLRVKIAIEIAFGMQHLHSVGMIHRDLKIGNIMLNYVLEAKIIDFDLVHIKDNDEGIGTLEYMSPEMLNKQKYDNKTDVYSYGIVLFVLFTGHLPKQNSIDKMNKKPIQFPHSSSSFTKECIEIIQKCTSFYAKDRPNFTEIIDYMKSKSFCLAKEVDIDIVNNRFQELYQLQNEKCKIF